MSPRSFPWVKLLPSLVPLGILFIGGFGTTLVRSGIFQSLEAYFLLMNSPGFGESALFSLRVAALSAGFSTTLALVLALTVWRLQGLHRFAGLGFYLPLILPPVSVGYLGIFWLGSRGMVAGVAQSLGMTFNSPLFRGDGVGLVLAYIYKEVPFGLLMILPLLRSIPLDMIHSARLLGARWPRILLTIILPTLVPVLSSTFLILFVYTFGAYDIPLILGESRPAMISQLLYRLYFHRPWEEGAQAAAGMVILFLASLLMVLMYERIMKNVGSRNRPL